MLPEVSLEGQERRARKQIRDTTFSVVTFLEPELCNSTGLA